MKKLAIVAAVMLLAAWPYQARAQVAGFTGHPPPPPQPPIIIVTGGAGGAGGQGGSASSSSTSQALSSAIAQAVVNFPQPVAAPWIPPQVSAASGIAAFASSREFVPVQPIVYVVQPMAPAAPAPVTVTQTASPTIVIEVAPPAPTPVVLPLAQTCRPLDASRATSTHHLFAPNAAYVAAVEACPAWVWGTM